MTEQESFWAGEFGNEYSERNIGLRLVSANTALFSKIMTSTHSVNSIIEFGSNIGLNVLAIKNILPHVELSAVEINEAAVTELKKIEGIRVYHQSIIDFKPDYERDFVLAKGIMIHINPEHLPNIYDLLYDSSNRYICIIEYYNPTPVEVTYRGHRNRLFKRDFAGEILDRFKKVRLVNYGFIYHRDNNFPQDDMTWFLMEKNS